MKIRIYVADDHALVRRGAYTASIRGASAAETGEVLFEVYFID